MSGTDYTTNAPPVPGEPVTEKIVISSSPPRPVGTPMGASTPGTAVPFDAASEPEDWPARGPAKGIRMGWPVAVLLVLLIGGGGIWGGAALQRGQGSTTSSLASNIASRFASRTGTGGAGRLGGAGGSAATSATAGTVTEVKGSTLYVTNSSGNLVIVNLTKSTKVTRNAKASIDSLQPGDTVVVQGTKASNGTVSASSVSDTAQGVASGFAGAFGG